MKTHFFILVFLISTIELILKLNLKIVTLEIFKSLKETFGIFNKDISDKEKEKFLVKSSKNLFFNSFKITLVLLVIFFIYYLGVYFNEDFNDYIFSIMGIIEISVLSIVYLKLRKFISEKL